MTKAAGEICIGCQSGEKERGMNMDDIFDLYLKILPSADCPSTATFR